MRAGLHHHSAGLIAYQVAGLLSIIPRCYSAGGSALSCRGVLLFSIIPAVYIIMQRCLLPIRKRVHGSGSRSYCLSCRAVLNHHAAWFCFIMPRGVVILNHAGGLHHHAAGLHHHSAGLIAYHAARFLIIMPAVLNHHAAGTWFR